MSSERERAAALGGAPESVGAPRPSSLPGLTDDQAAALATLGEVLPVACVLHDLERGRSVYGTRRLGTLLGYDTPTLLELLSRGRLGALLHPDDRGAFDHARDRHDAAGPGDVVHLRFRMRHTDGSWRWLHAESSVMTRDAGGRARIALAVVSDATASVLRAEQRRAAQKMQSLGRLAGGVAHGVNDLLTAIMGFGDLALEALPRDSAAAADLREVLVAARRASAVTEQLLDFCGRPPSEAPVQDARLSLTAVEKVLRAMVRSDVDLHFEAGDRALPVQLEPSQLELLLVNLVANGVEAMPEGGRILVRMKGVWLRAPAPARFGSIPRGPWAVLEVLDSGPGMDEQVQDQLFEPFFTTKAPGRSGGLGLAAVYGITRQVGGHLQVHSRPGEGSTFRVYLPLAEAGLEEPAVCGASARLRLEGAPRVWLVEDDPQVRAVAERALREHGFEIRDFASAEETLSASIAEAPPHLLVSDHILPGMSGLELARRLQQQVGELRVLLVSGFTTGHLLEKVPASVVLQKPYSGATLLARAQLALDGPVPLLG